MPTFAYKARDRSGKIVNGTTEAASPSAVAENLRKMGYAVLSISLRETRGAGIGLFDKLGGVTNSDITMFTRQLATLIDVGVPILSAMGNICEQTDNTILKDALSQVSVDIKGGTSLADALSHHPKCFDATYINMVKAAETSGTLSETLERLAVLLEYEEQTRNKIRSATRYPITVTVALCVAFTILTVFVLPRYAGIYSHFSMTLPLPTRILLGINFAIRHYWFLVIPGIGLIIFALNRYIKTKAGRMQWDTLKLKLPVFGPLFQKIAISRFMRVFGMMLKTGVPVLRVLDHVAMVSGNVIIAQSIYKIKEGVNMGKDMATMMRQDKLFPPISVQMVALGEESGRLDELMLKTSDFFDSQVDLTIQNLTSLLEPVLVVCLGLGVLLMALSVFLPMWNLVSLTKR